MLIERERKIALLETVADLHRIKYAQHLEERARIHTRKWQRMLAQFCSHLFRLRWSAGRAVPVARSGAFPDSFRAGPTKSVFFSLQQHRTDADSCRCIPLLTCCCH